MLYEEIFKSLHESKVRYVVIGGIAVNLHGYMRATADLDIAISLDDLELKKFIEIIKDLKLVPRLPVKLDDFALATKRDEWIREKNMQVFSVYNPNNPMEHIDIMINNVIEFDTLYKNRVVINEGGLKISIACISDLIKMKENAGRERDKIDIKALKRIEEITDEK